MLLPRTAICRETTLWIQKKSIVDVADIPEAEVLATLEMILANNIFIKAPRMSRLLRFLVEKAISGGVRDINQYDIGISIFDRDAFTYNPSEDPIVRIQVSRLRKKLKMYYATLGMSYDIEISIPLGCYLPIIRRKNSANADFKQYSMLAIHPFKCISHHDNGAPFTQGLTEEVMYQLFKVFGKIKVAYCFLTSGDANSADTCLKNACSVGVNHLLEGSIRIDIERIRASIRLIDISRGWIVWSEQFDQNILFVTSAQEELASSICDALRSFLSQK